MLTSRKNKMGLMALVLSVLLGACTTIVGSSHQVETHNQKYWYAFGVTRGINNPQNTSIESLNLTNFGFTKISQKVTVGYTQIQHISANPEVCQLVIIYKHEAERSHVQRLIDSVKGSGACSVKID